LRAVELGDLKSGEPGRGFDWPMPPARNA
jgi:hypothetical protein